MEEKNDKKGKCIIVRHHESDWNHEGLWTGIRDRHLTPYGFQKSEEIGLLLKDIHIDYAFASMQVRTIETLSSILEAKGQFQVPTEHVRALNERDYGDYTGRNKWEMENILGKDGWDAVRREWDCPVPNGETLKMVYERTVGFFVDKVVPLINEGKVVLIVSHGNAIRALMKYIESIPDNEVKNIEMLFGQILIYTLDQKGLCVSKEERKVSSNVSA